MKALIAGARAVGIDLDAAQQAAFHSYYQLLEERGRHVNLTAVHGWEAVREELFLRSLRALAVDEPPLSEAVRLRGEGLRAIDVGTGAGVPGLVLKIALPQLSIALLDATRKKTDFVADVLRELGLKDARAVNQRAEDAAHDRSLRERFDLVLARSVARLPELAELTLPFCRVGGTVVALKGADVSDEVSAAAFASNELGGAAPMVFRVDAPGTSPADSAVILRKTARTPDRYPRRAGLPHQRPLMVPVSDRSNRKPGPGRSRSSSSALHRAGVAA